MPIGLVPAMLDTVCRVTGMGFAAVARVTDERWIACSVLDDIAFGLQPGGELKLETTICHEIRQNEQAVVISDVAADEFYRDHHTPAQCTDFAAIYPSRSSCRAGSFSAHYAPSIPNRVVLIALRFIIFSVCSQI
jgi:hypothetical protein